MRRLLLLVLIVAVVGIALFRQRLFLRDPLGKVFVKGVVVDGARVFINYSNDVLVLRDGEPAVMVQGWDRTPGLPKQLGCVRAMVCWTESDQASKISLDGGQGGYEPKTVMGDRVVTYLEPDGAAMRVVIR